ncbi:Rib/alpha-like domain-containing protein [Lactobacillus paragasseri]|nr:Rib/alpha-like domain-containing protein [Lactobacillus paragasseri]MDK7068435.1 Rib/alpha-like domain-containing protein [Lactobacillus paragasseri]
MAENTSDSKKVASNRDVNVIKNDVTTDEKAAAKSSVQTDKDVNANKLDTNTVSVNKLQRNVNVAGLTESKAASENVEQEAEDSSLGARFMNHTNDFPSDATAIRTVTLNKPQSAGGSETITQKLGAFCLTQIQRASNTGNTTMVNFDFTMLPTLNGGPMATGTQDFSANLVFSNNNWTFASAEDEENYNKFLSFQPTEFKATLPAIEDSQIAVDGYTWKVTSATPDGAGLGAETLSPYAGISQNIVIDYTKEEHTVTYKFKDPFGNQVGRSVPVTGATGSNQSVSLTLPDGYQLASDSLPTSVTIPTSDQTIWLPVKHQLTITLSGEGEFNYADDNWKNLVKTNELPASGYYVDFNDTNARVRLDNGDVTYNENRNAGTYTVSLTEKGLNDIKDQLHDNFIYPDLKDVKSEAKFIIDKGNKTISLMGGDTKVFDNTSTLPDQGTFYSGLGLADNDQGRISVYNSDGTLRTIQLTPADVEFWFNGHKIAKDQAKNVGTYNLRLTDDFINKVKAADGNNGNNYEWAYGTHTPTGSDTYTADYVIYQATGKANLSGNNSKLYDGNAVTTTDVNKDGKITIDLTLPVYKKADAPGDEPQLLRTVPLGKYTLQDGDYTWANGTAPTKGGSYTIKLNKDKILAHLQNRLVALAGVGTDPDDSTKSLSNVTITTDDMAGQATFAIETTTAYQFVDDDDNGSKVGTPVSKTGLKGESSAISLDVPTNYVLAAGQTLPTSVIFGDTNTRVDIHLKHATKTVDKNNVPDGYTKDDFAKTINRTITAKEPTGDVDLSQKTELTRTGTYDEVTKKVVSYSDWTTDKFAEVSAPNVPGYTPSQAKVDGADVTVDSKFDPTVITYAPNAQKTTVTYVDKNGKEITNPDGSAITGSHYDVDGVTDQKNVPTNIEKNVPTNWHITDKTIPGTISFGPNGHDPIKVHVAHNTKPADKDNVPDGYKREDFDKTVTRTITAKEPSGDVDLSQHVELTRTGTYDEVTKEVTYNPWTTSSFVEVTAPEVAGYTPIKASVEAVDKVTSDYVDPKVVINYVPNDQKGKISYVDDKTNTEVGTTSLTGKTDEDVVINPVAPAGWKIVEGQNIPKTEKATPNGIDTVIVKVEHKTTTVPPTDPKTPEDKLPDNPDKHYPDGVGEKDLNKTIVRQITVVKPDGTRENHDQSVKLTRSATVDEVTGAITGYSDWTTGNFDEYDAPVIAGYTPSQAKVDGVKVTADSDFDPVVITYVEDPIGQDITVKKGDTPSPEDGVKNHGDLDKITDPKHPGTKTTYTWEKTPNTNVPGDVPATVIVHYPDGSNKPVDITVHVVDDTPVVPTKNPDPIGQDITVKKGDTPDPEDGVKNHGDLDKIIDPKHPGTKTTYTWKKTPDTSVAGDVPATVIVHYPDGSNKPVDITIHVVDDTPVVPTKNPDPIGQDITVKKGDTPDPEDGVKNHGDLDKITDPKHPGTKTTYTWKKTPDTSVASDVPATVIVHYPDGSNKPVDITVHVVDDTPVVPTKNPEPAGQDIHTPQGKVPTPESAITNKDKMPDGTKYTWKEIPDVNTLGKHPSVVVVTYPDGTAVEVKVNVFVDGTPEAKKETKAPVVKKQVVEPTKVETRQKLVNNYVAPRAVEVQRAQAKGKRQLPQTGAKENIASEVLGMLSVGLGALTAGFASKRRKKNR